MAGTINSESLTGISKNAIHLRNNFLVVTAMGVSPRVSKKVAALNDDKGNFQALFEAKSTSQANTLVDGELITDVQPSISRQNIKLNFDVALDLGTDGEAALKTLLDDMAGYLTLPITSSDYSEPAQDAPKYNFTGTYVYAETGTEFNVTGMSLV